MIEIEEIQIGTKKTTLERVFEELDKIETQTDSKKIEKSIKNIKRLLPWGKREKEKTFEDGINLARKTVLDIVEKYKEKPSDKLQKDLQNEINRALEKILKEYLLRLIR